MNRKPLIIGITFIGFCFCTGTLVDQPPMIACTSEEVLMINGNNWTMQSLYKNESVYSLTLFSSVDYHYEMQLVVIGQFSLTSTRRGEIATAKLVNGKLTEIKTLLKTNCKPEVAVDWIKDKIYWKCDNDNGATIYIANLDGSDVQTVQTNINLDGSSNFQVDPVNRLMYYRTQIKTDRYSTLRVLKRVNMDNVNDEQTLDTCDSYLCSYIFAIDHANNGQVYWMDFFTSTVNNVNAENKNKRIYDFGEYAFEKILLEVRKIVNTIDVVIATAYKGSLYGIPFYRLYDLNGALIRLYTDNTTLTVMPELPLREKLESYKVFHQSAQPKAVPRK